MTKTKGRLVALTLLTATLAGCVQPSTDQSIRVLRSDAERVVLRGLIDATRTTPPARYDALAQAECGRFGKTAVLVSMDQRSTFGFDVTYGCVAKG